MHMYSLYKNLIRFVNKRLTDSLNPHSVVEIKFKRQEENSKDIPAVHRLPPSLSTTTDPVLLASNGSGTVCDQCTDYL